MSMHRFLLVLLVCAAFGSMTAAKKKSHKTVSYVIQQRRVTNTQRTVKKTQALLAKAQKELTILQKNFAKQAIALKKARGTAKKKIQQTINRTKKAMTLKQKRINAIKKTLTNNRKQYAQAQKQLAAAHAPLKKAAKKTLPATKKKRPSPSPAKKHPVKPSPKPLPPAPRPIPAPSASTIALNRLDVCGGTAQIQWGYAPIANDATCHACFNNTDSSLLCLWCTANATAWYPVRPLAPLERAMLNSLDSLFDQCAQHYNAIVHNPSLWIGGTPTGHQRHYQKLIVPPSSTVFLWGDIHGGGLSLIESLMYLQKKNHLDLNLHVDNNTYLVFTGDYTDRGSRNVLTLYTLLQLATRNPQHVVILRGNHEQTAEGWAALPVELNAMGLKTLFAKLQRFQYQMPIMLFLGAPATDNTIHFWQVQHAATDIGIDARTLLADARPIAYAPLVLQRQAIAAAIGPTLRARAGHKRLTDDVTHIATTTQSAIDLDSLWADFATTRDITSATHPRTQFHLNSQPGRGPFYDKDLSLTLLDYQTRGLANATINGTIHGHQYHGQLKDTARNHVPGALWSWNNRLITLLANDEWMETYSVPTRLKSFYSSMLSLHADHSATGWHATRILLRCSNGGIGAPWLIQETPGPINAPPGAVDYTDF